MNFFHEETIDERLLPFIYNSPVFSKSTINKSDFIIHNQILWAEKDSVTEDNLKKLSNKYKFVDRFVIIFIVSDYKKKYHFYNNLIIVRTSLKASLKKRNEIVLPYLWDSFAFPFAPVMQQDCPHVGFCGFGSKYRKKIIKVFKDAATVKSDFIIREKFWGRFTRRSRVD